LLYGAPTLELKHEAFDNTSIVNSAECFQTQTTRVGKAQDRSLKTFISRT